MEKIRYPSVAGQFYDANPSALENHVRKLFANLAENSNNEKVQALILPHAGYVYSGKTAAKTCASAAGGDYKRIFVLAPSHRFPFEGLALCSYSKYEIPTGSFDLDRETVDDILKKGNGLIKSENTAHEGEHALEVQLPILYKLFKGVKIVPIICGALTSSGINKIAPVLNEYFTEENLWLVSSDFTHYGAAFSYMPFTDNIPGRIRELDMGAIDKILDFDSTGFHKYIDKTGASICGAGPIELLLKIIEIKKNEKLKASLVDYTTSGELTGDWSHSVSYAGIKFISES